MIASPVSFFLAAVPGTGYKLYRLTNSGGPGASLTKTTISEAFSKPSRPVNQPGTPAKLDPSDGNIIDSPYFDGRFIWFTHDGDDDGFPTVRYGAVDTRNNTVVTAWAFHSGSSDDFNPSLAWRSLRAERPCISTGHLPTLLPGRRPQPCSRPEMPVSRS
jgi:hypothetical protein